MKQFEYQMKTSVIYEIGAVSKLSNLCKSFGTQVFLITDEFMAKHSSVFPQILEGLMRAGLQVEVYSDVKPDPTIELVDLVGEKIKAFHADVLVALGGGSPMDTAKAAGLMACNEGSIGEYLQKQRMLEQDALPLICIPTTAGTGSEVTSGTVITDRQREEKIGLNHPSLAPAIALIDPEIQVSMPPSLTAATGLDALCHAIEAYTSRQANPLSDAMALQAIRLIGQNLRRVVSNGTDLEARGQMAVASLMAGISFAQAGLGLVHGIAHCLGAMYHVPHGVANAIMLPYVMEFNIMGNEERFCDIAAALGIDAANVRTREAAKAAVEEIRQLQADLEIPSLERVGVQEGDIDTIVANSITYRLLPNNPRTVSEKDIRQILLKALI